MAESKKEKQDEASAQEQPAPAEGESGAQRQDPYVLGTEEHLEDGTDLGAIRIHNNVIAVIARLAALKVPGVLEMSGTIVDGIAGMIGKRVGDRGIRVDVEENNVVLDLHVILEYGVRIPQVAWQIQNDVREAVQQMTGKNVRSINVVVQGVLMKGESLEGEREAES